METIKLNGEDYIKQSLIEKEYVLRSELDKDYVLKSSVDKVKFEDLAINLTDEATAMGMGSCVLSGNWKTVKVSIDYLEKAIKALRLMTYDKKRESLYLAVTKDYPLCLGDIKGDKFSGIIIAPRIDSD
jgi:hypothetical protein